MTALVHHGLDTDDNLNLMFGSHTAPGVRQLQTQVRVGVLLGALEGSPNFAVGLRGERAVDPDSPASDVVMALLPDWQRPLKAEEKGVTCAICTEKLVSPVQSLRGCTHVFHPSCIKEWFSRKSSCPLCRKPLPLVAPRPASEEELKMMERVRQMQATLLAD